MGRDRAVQQQVDPQQHLRCCGGFCQRGGSALRVTRASRLQGRSGAGAQGAHRTERWGGSASCGHWWLELYTFSCI